MAIASGFSVSRCSSSSTIPESVVIDTAASDDPEALAADLRALGGKKVTVFGRMVSAVMPTEAIPGLNSLSSLQLARSAPVAISQGTVTSQGDKVMRSDIARASVGADGAGVMVGTISDSYNCFGNAADGVASGDLPAGTLVIEEGPCIWMARDEGRAMMEVITMSPQGYAMRSLLHTTAKPTLRRTS
jgi:hypothetical protein